jgi:hypothetical protein
MRSPVACRSTASKKLFIPMMVFGASGLFLSGAAFAAPTPAAPGDNGDVKIHKSTTDPMDQRNEPEVCLLYPVGFNFDAGNDLEYRIVDGPFFKSPPVLSGGINIDPQGYGKTWNLSLPDGHYKLYADENGKAKRRRDGAGLRSFNAPVRAVRRRPGAAGRAGCAAGVAAPLTGRRRPPRAPRGIPLQRGMT